MAKIKKLLQYYVIFYLYFKTPSVDTIYQTSECTNVDT